jgi:hypothetical protein
MPDSTSSSSCTSPLVESRRTQRPEGDRGRAMASEFLASDPHRGPLTSLHARSGGRGLNVPLHRGAGTSNKLPGGAFDGPTSSREPSSQRGGGSQLGSRRRQSPAFAAGPAAGGQLARAERQARENEAMKAARILRIAQRHNILLPPVTTGATHVPWTSATPPADPGSPVKRRATVTARAHGARLRGQDSGRSRGNGGSGPTSSEVGVGRKRERGGAGV